MKNFTSKEGKKETLQAASHSRMENRGGGFYLEDNRPKSVLQRQANNTGLPDNLKSGVENLSGYSMDDVKVHYNSSKPTQLNAHAYAQGTDIHLASGQEKHLPHEAWHVVQQKQGRVQPTKQLKENTDINDDESLEKEADKMGEKASTDTIQKASIHHESVSRDGAIQLKPWEPQGNLPWNAVQITDVLVNGTPFNGREYRDTLPVSLDKTSAMIAASNYIATLGVPEKNKFLTQKVLNKNMVQGTQPGPYNNKVPPATWPGDGQGWNNYRNNWDPFLLELTVPYGPIGAIQNLVLTYAFGRGSYGYVVRIQQGGGDFTMNQTQGQNVALGANEFASGHDTDDTANNVSAIALTDTDDPSIHAVVPDDSLSTAEIVAASAIVGVLAKDYSENQIHGVLGALLTSALGVLIKKSQQETIEMKRRSERSTRLDAIAKIAGEAPRWQAVRALATTGNLKNDSRFYTIQPGTNIPFYVTFQTLWGSWDSVFSAAWDISDGKIKKELLNQAANWNGAGVQQEVVGYAGWTASDIPV